MFNMADTFAFVFVPDGASESITVRFPLAAVPYSRLLSALETTSETEINYSDYSVTKPTKKDVHDAIRYLMRGGAFRDAVDEYVNLSSSDIHERIPIVSRITAASNFVDSYSSDNQVLEWLAPVAGPMERFLTRPLDPPAMMPNTNTILLKMLEFYVRHGDFCTAQGVIRQICTTGTVAEQINLLRRLIDLPPLHDMILHVLTAVSPLTPADRLNRHLVPPNWYTHHGLHRALLRAAHEGNSRPLRLFTEFMENFNAPEAASDASEAASRASEAASSAPEAASLTPEEAFARKREALRAAYDTGDAGHVVSMLEYFGMMPFVTGGGAAAGGGGTEETSDSPLDKSSSPLDKSSSSLDKHHAFTWHHWINLWQIVVKTVCGAEQWACDAYHEFIWSRMPFEVYAKYNAPIVEDEHDLPECTDPSDVLTRPHRRRVLKNFGQWALKKLTDGTMSEYLMTNDREWIAFEILNWMITSDCSFSGGKSDLISDDRLKIEVENLDELGASYLLARISGRKVSKASAIVRLAAAMKKS
jgi:hypothetical protein